MARQGIVPSWLSFAAASFIRDNCLILAASLSYATVLALVPCLAVAFSVAKGLGIYDAPGLREALMRLTAEKTDVVNAILGYISNTNLKALGYIGVASLFITSLGLFGAMETAFNVIWRAKSMRSWWSRFTNYSTVILVCPVFILAAMSATASLQSPATARWLHDFSLLNTAYLLVLKAFPHVMVWMALFILYRFLPNVAVRSGFALLGAVLAGSAWQATEAVYIRYQVGVTGYNAIYGSFAQIPLLMVWLYLSWLIVLGGAEIAHALENSARIALEAKAGGFSQAERRNAALLLALLLTGRFTEGHGRISQAEAAERLNLPVSLTAQVLGRLARLGLAAAVAGEREQPGWVLAADPDKVSVGELFQSWDVLPGEGHARDLADQPEVIRQVNEVLDNCVRTGLTQSLREAWQSWRQGE